VEAVKCHHREKVESTPTLPGIEIGTCSICGQTIQYDHNGLKTKVSVTRLGRIDGKIVIPKHGLQLLLSAEDKGDLEAVLSAAAAELAPAPAAAAELAPTSAPPRPKKRGKLKEYFEQNKEAIINDYYLRPQRELFSKWGLSSSTWMKLKAKWKVAPKGPVNRFTGAPLKTSKPSSEKVTTGSNGALPPFPPFNEKWIPQVKIEWFKTYKELSLAQEGGVKVSELDSQIRFWKDGLAQHRLLMSPSAVYMVEQTIKALEELKKRVESKEQHGVLTPDMKEVNHESD